MAWRWGAAPVAASADVTRCVRGTGRDRRIQVAAAWCFLTAVCGGAPGSERADQKIIIEESKRCDAVVDAAVCHNDGTVALSAPALSEGLIGHWPFDAEGLEDMSGYEHNSFIDALERGPSATGAGFSAAFKGAYLTISAASIQGLWGNQFTYSFWILLADEGSSGGVNATGTQQTMWCPVLTKSRLDKDMMGASSGSPSLLLNVAPGFHMGRLRASLSVAGTMVSASVESHARLLPHRWTHIAITYNGNDSSEGSAGRLSLVVNGILDGQLDAAGDPSFDEAPIYVGGDPAAPERCDQKVYIDEFRIFNRAMKPVELQAESFLALGGAGPEFAHFGCSSCSFQEAATICPATRHLCSKVELDVGGYQVAQAMGWLHPGMRIWTLIPREDDHGLGLALCCADEPDDD